MHVRYNQKNMFWGVCKNIKGVFIYSDIFPSRRRKNDLLFTKESDTSQTSTSRQTRRVGIYKGGPRVFKTEKEFKSV